MAWIYLAESEDSDLPCHPGCIQSPIVKTTDTLKLSYCRGCKTVNYQWLQSGQTCELCKGNLWLVSSTSFTAGSLVRISALQAAVTAWEESEADYFQKSCAWPKKSSPSSYSLKMSQQLELGGSTMWPNGLPSQAMIVDGILYPLRKLAPFIFASVGSYLPTPTASDYGKNNGRNSKDPEKSRDRWSLTVRARRGKLPGHPSGRLNPMWIEQLMGYSLMWTEINAWATRWFRSKQGKRLKDCVESNDLEPN